MIARLQHITQDIEGFSHLDQITQFCEVGGKWTQLRLKNQSIESVLVQAKEARTITNKYACRLIINDNVAVAEEVKADGVHLGKNDMSTTEAREILGSKTIIGRTCNSFEDIVRECSFDIDYIGLGPFRYTPTKKQLDPVLGLEGYKKIIRACNAARISLPIIAIGGITEEDVLPIIQAGIYGVAVSSSINKSIDMNATVSSFHEILKQ